MFFCLNRSKITINLTDLPEKGHNETEVDITCAFSCGKFHPINDGTLAGVLWLVFLKMCRWDYTSK